MNSEEMVVLVVVDSVLTTSPLPMTLRRSVIAGRSVMFWTTVSPDATAISPNSIFWKEGRLARRTYPWPGGTVAIRNSPCTLVTTPSPVTAIEGFSSLTVTPGRGFLYRSTTIPSTVPGAGPARAGDKAHTKRAGTRQRRRTDLPVDICPLFTRAQPRALVR